jgi:hypothetical protein
MKNKLKSKIFVSDIFLGLSFLIIPFWSMILILFQLFKTRRGFYTVLISSLFGITASLLAPTGDLYRLYITYFDFQNYDFNAFLGFIKYKPDFLFYALLYVFAKMGLSIRILIFLLVYGYFQLSFNLLLKQSGRIKVLVMLLFVMQFDFLLQGLFLRFPMAMLLVIYAYLNGLERRKNVLILLILASMIHFAALITIPIFYITRLSFRKIQIALFCSILLMPFGSVIFSFLAELLLNWFPNMPLAEKLDIYFLGYWALEYFDERTWKALVQFYFERAFYFLILLYFLVTKQQGEQRKISLGFLILVNLLFSFPNLFGRYLVLASFFGLFCIITEQKKTALSKLIRFSLAGVIVIVFSIRILAQQKNIRVGYIPKVTYSNFITLMRQNYDQSWIEKHIDAKTASPKTVKSL